MELRPYITLMRLHKPIGIWLLAIPCWWGILLFTPSISWHTLSLALLFLFGAIIMRSAGCIVNDIADRHIDAQVERTQHRPLACGVITLHSALILLFILLMFALFIANMLGWKIVVLGFCWLPLVIAYPFMKRITWWPQAFLGITFGAGGLFGMIAVLGEFYLSGIILYIATIFWVIGYDTVYACQDKIDDAAIGVKSTALLFGSHAKIAISLCYVVMILLLCISFYMTQASFYAWAGVICAAIMLACHIVIFNPHNPGLCAVQFSQHLWVGMIIATGLLLSRLG
jgi:4-hydroxybenzoate polyprenyltransferase